VTVAATTWTVNGVATLAIRAMPVLQMKALVQVPKVTVPTTQVEKKRTTKLTIDSLTINAHTSPSVRYQLFLPFVPGLGPNSPKSE
jgi:hypothetical protein